MSDSVVEVVAELYKQWILGATKPRGPVLPKATFQEHPERNYSLKNKITHHYLQHEEEQFGINLGWTDDGSNATGDKVARWFFTRNGTTQAPIEFGETIALGNGEKPSFVKYEERTFGINLAYSDTPVFEWKILGGKKGDPVSTQSWIVLFNEKGGECLIYFDRTVGADIGWPSSKTWSDQLGDLIEDDLKKAITNEVKQEAVKLLLLA
jgi:hypothetical protein